MQAEHATIFRDSVESDSWDDQITRMIPDHSIFLTPHLGDREKHDKN
jgi:hypothetical protein